MAEYSIEDFAKEVKERIKEFLPDSYEESRVEIKQVPKNNEILHGLIVANEDSVVIPNIYLEYYFEQYRGGVKMEDILQNIASVRVANENGIDFDVTRFCDYNNIKDQIVPRLIGKDNNAEFLANHPYSEMADLAVVYAVKLEHGEDGFMSAPITDALAEQWHVSADDLRAQAVANMEEVSKPTFRNMFDVLDEMMPGVLGDSSAEAERVPGGMYVLSNQEGNFGAAAILDDKFMAQISERLGSDFWVLPSSVHELILLPNNGSTMELEGLEQMVAEVNDTQLAPQDLLSYHVYHYDAETKELYRADQKEEHELSKASRVEANKEDAPRESLRGKLSDKQAEVEAPSKKAPSKSKHKDQAAL